LPALADRAGDLYVGSVFAGSAVIGGVYADLVAGGLLVDVTARAGVGVAGALTEGRDRYAGARLGAGADFQRARAGFGGGRARWVVTGDGSELYQELQSTV